MVVVAVDVVLLVLDAVDVLTQHHQAVDLVHLHAALVVLVLAVQGVRNLAASHVVDVEDALKLVHQIVNRDVKDARHLVLCHVPDVEVVVVAKEHASLGANQDARVVPAALEAAHPDVVVVAQAVVEPAQVVVEIAVVTAQERAVLLVLLDAADVVVAVLDVLENVPQPAKEVAEVHAHLAVAMLAKDADLDVQTLVLVDAGALVVVAVLQLAEDVLVVLENVALLVELIV